VTGVHVQAPPDAVIEADVARALAEDIGSGDVTAALLPDVPEHGYILVKEDAVLAGRPWFDACFRALDPAVRITWRVGEGDRVTAGTVVCTFSGRSRPLVSAERCALNFLQTLSGTATRQSIRTAGSSARKHASNHGRPATTASSLAMT
jgi:nicotinate-nucleotide pyrophosphorylase (carboxylating)